MSQPLEEVDICFEECRRALDGATRRALDNPNEDGFYHGLELEDSISQITTPVNTFFTSIKLARKIEVERKRIEF